MYRTVVCLSVLSCPVCNVGVLWPKGWTDQDETWHAGRPRPWRPCVRWRHRFLSPKGPQPLPQFLAYICCGQMAGWIKMPLGEKVGLDPSDILFGGDPAPLPRKGAEPPIFVPCLLWPNGCMDQDATWYVGTPQPRPHCARWGPSSPPKKGGTAFPQFLADVYCAQRLDGSRCHVVWR